MNKQEIAFDNYKIYLINDFGYNDRQKIDNLYYKIVYNYFKFLEYKNKKNIEGYNFPLYYNFPVSQLDYDFFDSLYYKFIFECINLFGPFSLLHTNSKEIFAYVSNNHNFEGTIHNHESTSVINAVYYFNVPDAEGGYLNFYDSRDKIIYQHKPSNNQLIIFDGTLLHMPMKLESDEFRISLNMEVKCSNEPLKFLRK